MKALDLPVVESNSPPASVAGPSRDRLLTQGIRLEYVSLGWNVVEGIVAVIAGLAAGSVALLGFGIDSFVESTSAGVIVWRILAERRSADHARIQSTERLAQKLVAASLALLGTYVLVESSRSLLTQERPDVSAVGIGLAIASLGVMWWLARSIRRVGRQLHSHSIEADSSQTLACWWMSLFLLVGLALNAMFGWWWADPLAGIGISAFVFRESWNAWRGKDCCAL